MLKPLVIAFPLLVLASTAYGGSKIVGNGFYVIYDKQTKDCSVESGADVTSKGQDDDVIGDTYKSEDEADEAMIGMEECGD